MVTRFLSAFIALPIALYLIGMGGWWFGSLILIVAAVGLNEFFRMTQPSDPVAQWGLTAFGVFIVYAALTGYLNGSRALIFMSAMLIGLLTYFLFRTGNVNTVGNRVSLALLGLGWAGGLLAVTACLRLLPGGTGWLILACALAWGSDSGAYFGGRMFGRTKLYPKVSPNKTWEGSVVGVFTAALIAFAVREVLTIDIATSELFALSALGAVMGQIGDLSESLLKRSVGVKDSGSIMPGHGGLFDRLDALMFTGPAVFAYAAGWRALSPVYLSGF
ncbi:MAG: phosphatidate cytidylyltransferase [Myxococcota bacterium]